jgi:hypothetical protein
MKEDTLNIFQDRVIIAMKTIKELILMSNPKDRMEVVVDPENILLVHQNFILTAPVAMLSYEGILFELNCEVGATPKDIAECMKAISTVIDPQQLAIAENFCVDTATNKVSFDDEATRTKVRNINGSRGLYECLCCERFIPKEHIDEGFCPFCRINIMPFISYC